jgi:hypothetical protein
MQKDFKKIKRNGGAAMLISVVFFLFITLAIISGLVSPSVREFKNSNDAIKSRQSLFLSESGAEDVYFRLKTAKSLSSPETLSLNGNTTTTTITDSGYNQKTITALGNVSQRRRNNKLVLTTGDGVSFSYGVQSGVGGFEIGNARVNGNVYSNGNITGANGATITGSAFAAGATGTIDNIDVGDSTTGKGDIKAHTVKDSTAVGNIYCQVWSNNNKSCNTLQADPAPAAMPITQAMTDKWKADAALGETITGDLTISQPTSLGPKKITGNLAINADLTITGTIYVMGNITTQNGAKVSLSSSYGAQGGIIIADGRVTLSNNVQFSGSGTAGTYILLITTSACPAGCSGLNAMEILNNVGAVLVSAQNGTVHLNNNVTLNEVVGNKIIIDNSAVINYLSGLANENFSSGPSGGWNIESWKEIE